MSDLKRWQFSLNSFLFITMSIAICISQVIGSVKAMYSQLDARDAQSEVFAFRSLASWSVGMLLVVVGFGLIARKTIFAKTLGLALVVVGMPVFWLPNVFIVFELLGGI